MTKDENNLFHANYKYMWNKLSTTYYHVKTGTPKASHIQGGAWDLSIKLQKQIYL